MILIRLEKDIIVRYYLKLWRGSDLVDLYCMFVVHGLVVTLMKFLRDDATDIEYVVRE